LKRTWTRTWTCPFKVDLDLDLDLRIRDLNLDLDLAVAGLVTSLYSRTCLPCVFAHYLILMSMPETVCVCCDY